MWLRYGKGGHRCSAQVTSALSCGLRHQMLSDSQTPHPKCKKSFKGVLNAIIEMMIAKMETMDDKPPMGDKPGKGKKGNGAKGGKGGGKGGKAGGKGGKGGKGGNKKPAGKKPSNKAGAKPAGKKPAGGAAKKNRKG